MCNQFELISVASCSDVAVNIFAAVASLIFAIIIVIVKSLVFKAELLLYHYPNKSKSGWKKCW